MEAIGLSAGMFFEQFIVLILFLGLPIISLIDLAKRKLTGIPLAIWAVFHLHRSADGFDRLLDHPTHC